MPKEELKNKISIALKDPVLQIGFEIICKENAELKGQIENLEGIKLSQGSALEKEYAINESLKEENAKLKERNSELAGQRASLQRWLGEAVRLLTRFVWASAYFNGEEADLVEVTKQFLQEV